MSIGRPPLQLTDKIKERLLEAIRKGAPYSIACDYAGIGKTTFYQWKKDAKEGKNEVFAEFMNELKEAQGETALKWLEVIDKAMTDQWTAAAWKLERRYYEEFGTNPQTREEMKKMDEAIADLKKKYGELSHGKEAQEVHTESTE